MNTVSTDFSRSLALLRKERGISQRTASKELGISQALLSHYENGVREPGLNFVVKACDYYNVSADFLLGRTMSRDGTTILSAETLPDAGEEKDNVLRGSVLATLSRKLLVNSISMVFDLLGKTGDRRAIQSAAQYLSTAVYKVFRHLYRANRANDENIFSLSSHRFLTGIPVAEMIHAETDYVDALANHVKEKGELPDMSHAALTDSYPGHYQSLLQIVHTTDERINRRINAM